MPATDTDALIFDLARVSCEEVYDDTREPEPEVSLTRGFDSTFEGAAQRVQAVRDALASRYGDAELHDALCPVIAFLETLADGDLPF